MDTKNDTGLRKWDTREPNMDIGDGYRITNTRFVSTLRGYETWIRVRTKVGYGK